MTDTPDAGFSDIDANDETEPVQDGTQVTATDSDAAKDTQDTEGKTQKTFTADEVNELIEKRLAREKRNAEEAKRKASMSAAERARTEKEEAEKQAAERIDQANTRVVRSEAKLMALDAGVRPDRAKAVLELARGELANVEVDEFGDPDADAIKAAIDAVVKDYPEFTTEGARPKFGKAPDASRETPQIDTSTPENAMAGHLLSILQGRV